MENLFGTLLTLERHKVSDIYDVEGRCKKRKRLKTVLFFFFITQPTPESEEIRKESSPGIDSPRKLRSLCGRDITLWLRNWTTLLLYRVTWKIIYRLTTRNTRNFRMNKMDRISGENLKNSYFIRNNILDFRLTMNIIIIEQKTVCQSFEGT